MVSRTERVRTDLASCVAAAREEESRIGDEGVSVHDARVAVRRVRSVLRSFPSLAPDERRKPVEEGLRSWSHLLGAVRDLEVLRETLAEVGTPNLLAQVTARLDRGEAEAWTRLRAELDSPGHHALMEDLEGIALGEPDGRLHPRRHVRRAARRAAKRFDRAGDDPTRLHRARRAVKRARYAAEAIGASDEAARHEKVQDALGRHHDCIVAARWLADSGLPADETAAARDELARQAAAALGSLG